LRVYTKKVIDQRRDAIAVRYFDSAFCRESASRWELHDHLKDHVLPQVQSCTERIAVDNWIADLANE
jgi:hypothetical protein